MANLFFKEEKASREEARKALMEHIADNWADRFTVNFHSDDGGVHIQAVLEFEDTSELMPDKLRSKFPAKWIDCIIIII